MKMSYLNEVRTVFRHAFRLPLARLSVVNYSKSATPKDDEVYNEDNEGKVSVTELLVDEELDQEAREQEIAKMRNKSRLKKTQRNVLFDQTKPLDEYQWDHTVYFSRKQYGQFGSASGVDPRICFYTPGEMADKEEYERVAYPLTVPEMVENIKREKAEQANQIKEREDQIAANLAKLDKWTADLKERVAKKEEEARLAKQRREQLLDDIRAEIGFKIDFKDPRFKTLMEQKELEVKKAKKAEKKQKRETFIMEKLKEQAQITLQQQQPQPKEKPKEKLAADDDAEDAEDTSLEKNTKAKDKGKVKDKSKSSKDAESSDSDSDDENTTKKKKK